MLCVASKTDSKVYQINPDNGKLCSLLSDKDKVGQPRYVVVQPLKEKHVVVQPLKEKLALEA